MTRSAGGDDLAAGAGGSHSQFSAAPGIGPLMAISAQISAPAFM